MSTRLSKLESGSSVRTFLAIDLPDSLRAELARLEPAFASHASALKWTSENLLHITVRFLGSVTHDRMGAVEGAAQKAASQVAPFRLKLSGLGAFPSEGAPRVIWVGLQYDAGYGRLEQLFASLESALARSGFPREERGFSPHITLARTRDHISRDERRYVGQTLRQMQSSRGVTGEWEVDRLIVMKSDLSRTGPHYTRLAVYPLTGSLEGGETEP